MRRLCTCARSSAVLTEGVLPLVPPRARLHRWREPTLSLPLLGPYATSSLLARGRPMCRQPRGQHAARMTCSSHVPHTFANRTRQMHTHAVHRCQDMFQVDARMCGYRRPTERAASALHAHWSPLPDPGSCQSRRKCPRATPPPPGCPGTHRPHHRAHLHPPPHQPQPEARIAAQRQNLLRGSQPARRMANAGVVVARPR